MINFVAKGTDLRGRGEGSQAGERLLTPGDGAEGGLGKGRGRGGRKQQDSQSSEGRLDFPGDPVVRT